MRRLRKRRAGRMDPELDITAFMNLMVILVPFLLITASFSEISVFKLGLPHASDELVSKLPDKELQLEVIISEKSLVVADTNRGPLKVIENTTDGYELEQLSGFLKILKTRYPDKKNILILSQQNTHYQSVIDVMDAVRGLRIIQDGTEKRIELFPEISLGDAPDNSPGVVAEKGRGRS